MRFHVRETSVVNISTVCEVVVVSAGFRYSVGVVSWRVHTPTVRIKGTKCCDKLPACSCILTFQVYAFEDCRIYSLKSESHPPQILRDVHVVVTQGVHIEPVLPQLGQTDLTRDFVVDDAALSWD